MERRVAGLGSRAGIRVRTLCNQPTNQIVASQVHSSHEYCLRLCQCGVCRNEWIEFVLKPKAGVQLGRDGNPKRNHVPHLGLAFDTLLAKGIHRRGAPTVLQLCRRAELEQSINRVVSAGKVKDRTGIRRDLREHIAK